MTDLMEYKCPSCGAPIKYDSTKDKMHCEFCDAIFSLADLQKYDESLSEDVPQKDFSWQDDVHHEELEGNLTGMNCSSCGAEIVGDENTIANECPYCGNTNIIKKQISGMYKPDFIIPFKIQKKEAIAALANHYKGRKLLPDAFTSGNRIENIQGVYLPFWLVDGKADVDAMYEASQVARTWSDKDYDYTMIRYYSLVRRGRYSFEKVPVDASSKMDDTLMEAIEPFNCKDVRDFASAYLSGYLTDKYDVDNKSCQQRANERIKNTAMISVRKSTDKYPSVSTKKCNINLEEGNINYALFPVWILTTRYKNKPYTFAMNGQTGKLVGDLPVDKGKLNKYMMMTFAGGFLASYLVIKYLLIAILIYGGL